MGNIPLIVIVGPTSIGKTDASISVASYINGEIISADSMQVYKYMDIGTAKPSIDERQGIPHYMIDVVEPDDEFNVAIFQQLAIQKIDDINNRRKKAILVGGSGLYVNSIVYPMDFTEAYEDHLYRSYLYEQLSSKGKEFLYNKLERIDPDTANRLHPNDTKRIIRALEIYHITGKTMSQFKQDFNNISPPYKPLIMIGLTMERSRLYERINKRVDTMVSNGLIDEVRSLLKMGYTKNMVSMQGLGYKEIIAYLEGDCTLDDALETLKRDTRRFAKRQYTWFKRDKRIYWINIDMFSTKSQLTDCIISYINEKLSSI